MFENVSDRSGYDSELRDERHSAAQITIPAGQNSGTVTLNAIVDNVRDNQEKAVMNLKPGSGYSFPTVGKKTKAPSATVTIGN
jgi:hypothetical protein